MKKLKILAACLIVALMATGVAYAAWSQNLNINGTVNTGSFGFEWDQYYSFGAPFDRNVDDGLDFSYSVEKLNANTLEVTMTNLYPGAGIKLDALGRNKGSIPAKFTGATLRFYGPTGVENDADVEAVLPYLRSHGTFAWNQTGTSSTVSRVIQVPNPTTGQWPEFQNFDDDMNKYLTNNPLNPYAVKEVFIEKDGWFSLDKDPNETSPNCIYIKIDENAPKSISGKTITFVLTSNFAQAQ